MKKTIGVSLTVIMGLALLTSPAGAALIDTVNAGCDPCGIYGMASVPEPATLLVLMVSGLVAVGTRLLRRHRSTA